MIVSFYFLQVDTYGRRGLVDYEEYLKETGGEVGSCSMMSSICVYLCPSVHPYLSIFAPLLVLFAPLLLPCVLSDVGVD